MSQCDSYCLGKKYFGSCKLASLRVCVCHCVCVCNGNAPKTVEGGVRSGGGGLNPSAIF